MKPSFWSGFCISDAARSIEWKRLRLLTTEKIAFCTRGCPFSTDLKGQVTNEAVFLERFLHQRRRPEHRVEETAVVDHREDRFLHQGLSVFYCQGAPQFENQSRYIDLARTHFRAVAALDAQALDVVRRLERVEPRAENGADAARLGLAEHVPAHEAEHRTDVEARGTADALHSLLELRILARSI